jgi:glycosyltransferase involved in cell wall biosynthesis
MMKVSIITVTYNSAEFLEECICSVKNQDYPDIEHIIIDGGSVDATLDIIKRYEGKNVKWISEKDNGMYDALNKGMKLATGDIVGALNSDDVFASSDVVTEIVNSFCNSRIDSVYGDIVYVSQSNTKKVIRYWEGYSYNRDRFRYGWMPAHPSFYVRRELVEELGSYESHYYTAADYEFMLRYLYHYRISAQYIPKLIVKMRVGGASNKTLSARLRANRRDYLAMKKNHVPLPFIASILKLIIKVRQYYDIDPHKVKIQR